MTEMKVDTVPYDHDDIFNELREIAQRHSNFQLVHFVTQLHETPHRMRYQVLRELQIGIGEIERAELRIEQIQRDIARLEAATEQDADLRIAEKRIDLRDIELDLIARKRECETLCAIRDALPRYTYEEFQALEPEYWQKRLTRQLDRSHFAALNAVDCGAVEAIEQAMREEMLPGVGRIENVCLKQLPGEGGQAEE